MRDTGSLTTTSTFGPANITSTTANYTTYTKTSGSTTETLRLLNKRAQPLISLTYVDYGRWRRATTASGTTNVNDTYVVFGTKVADVGRDQRHRDLFDDRRRHVRQQDRILCGQRHGHVQRQLRRAGTITYSTTASATPETGGHGLLVRHHDRHRFDRHGSSSFKGTGAVNGSGYAMDVAATSTVRRLTRSAACSTSSGNGGNGTGAIAGN